VLTGHEAAVTSVSYKAGCLASASTDGKLKIWSQKGTEITELSISSDPVTALSMLIRSRSVTALSMLIRSRSVTDLSMLIRSVSQSVSQLPRITN